MTRDDRRILLSCAILGVTLGGQWEFGPVMWERIAEMFTA